MSCSAQQPKQMQIVHTQKQKQVPRVALCPSRPGQITFQDWVWFTFGPIRGWHTYRKKPGPVSSLSPWLILKEVLNISAPLSLHPGLLDTQALRVTQQQATIFSCRLLGCQLPLLQLLCWLPCEPLTPPGLDQSHWCLCPCFRITDNSPVNQSRRVGVMV